jgi:hypothetical protein
MLYVASAVALVALITAGFTLGSHSKSTTSAAVTPAAVQSCNFPINITKINVQGRKLGGGRDVDVFWQAPSNLPQCVAISEYKVFVKLHLPNIAPDKEITVAGNRTSATVSVPGFPISRDPESVTAKVTAVLKVNAAAAGSKSERVVITP